MIKAVHFLIYSDDPPATRAFRRDVLGWPYVEDPRSPGWLIFKSGWSEIGVHPTADSSQGNAYSSPRHQSISLLCQDVVATKAELGSRGATFSGGITDAGFGRAINLNVPGTDDILLYQPKHPEVYSL